MGKNTYLYYETLNENQIIVVDVNSQNDAKARNWDRYHNNSDANLEPKNTKSIPVLVIGASSSSIRESFIQCQMCS